MSFEACVPVRSRARSTCPRGLLPRQLPTTADHLWSLSLRWMEGDGRVCLVWLLGLCEVILSPSCC